jgi:hypothetical protein
MTGLPKIEKSDSLSLQKIKITKMHRISSKKGVVAVASC